MKNYLYLLTFMWLILPYIILCQGKISDKRLCGDPDCNEAVSYGKTLIRYISDDPRILSFSPNLEVTVFSKSAGSRPDLWGAQINEKRGYVPKNFVREFQVVKKKLAFVLPTEEYEEFKQNLRPNATEKADEEVDVENDEEPHAVVSSQLPMFTSPEDMEFDRVSQSIIPDPNKQTSVNEVSPSFASLDNSPKSSLPSKTFFPSLLVSAEQDVPRDDEAFTVISGTTVYFDEDGGEKTRHVNVKDTQTHAFANEDVTGLVEPSIVDASVAASGSLDVGATKQDDELVKPTAIPPSGSLPAEKLLKTASMADSAESGYDSTAEIKPTEAADESIMGYLTSLNSWFSVKEEEIKSNKEENEEESDELGVDEMFDEDDSEEEEEEDGGVEIEEENEKKEDSKDAKKKSKGDVKTDDTKKHDGSNDEAKDVNLEEPPSKDSPQEKANTENPSTDSPQEKTNTENPSTDSPQENTSTETPSAVSAQEKTSTEMPSTDTLQADDLQSSSSTVEDVAGIEGVAESSTENASKDTEKENGEKTTTEKTVYGEELTSGILSTSTTTSLNQDVITEIPVIEGSSDKSVPQELEALKLNDEKQVDSDPEIREKRETEEDKNDNTKKKEEDRKREDKKELKEDSSEDHVEAGTPESDTTKTADLEELAQMNSEKESNEKVQEEEEMLLEPESTQEDISHEKVVEEKINVQKEGAKVVSEKEILPKERGEHSKENDVHTVISSEEVGAGSQQEEIIGDHSAQIGLGSELHSSDGLKESSSEIAKEALSTDEVEKSEDSTEETSLKDKAKVEDELEIDAKENKGQNEAEMTSRTEADKVDITKEESTTDVSEVGSAKETLATDAIEEKDVKEESETEPKEEKVDDSQSGGLFGWLGFSSGSESQDASETDEAEPSTESPALDTFTEIPIGSPVEDISAKNHVESDDGATTTPLMDEHSLPIFLGDKLPETSDSLAVTGIPQSVVASEQTIHSSLFGREAFEKESLQVCESGPESACDDHQIGKMTTGDDTLSGQLTKEQMGEMSDSMKSATEDISSVPPGMTLYMVITSITVLVFTLGYYVIQKLNREEPLLAQMNVLEKKLFVVSREAECMKEELSASNETLAKYEHCSQMSDQEVEDLKAELEENKQARGELEEQVASLERELETATEAGLELNQMLSEFLSSQRGSDDLFSSVEKLQQQLNCQQGIINSMNESVNTKSQENEALLTEVSFTQAKASALEEEVKRLSEALSKLEEEKKRASDDLSEKSDLLLELREAKDNLDKVFAEKDQEATDLSEKVSSLDRRLQEVQESLSARDSEVLVLQDCLTQLKLSKDGENADVCKEQLEALTNVGRARADLKKVTDERDNLKEKLEDEEGARKLLEDHVRIIKEEVEQLRKGHELAEKEKREALTRLEVLSNYFKEKETQLQKELGLQEAIVAFKDTDVSTTHNKVKALETEVENQRAQVELLKKEVVDQERNLKGQISTLEKKAHENWVAARQAERKVEEAKQEASQLRNRLTMNEKVALNATADIVKPVPRHGGESNGEIPLSPIHHLDNPNMPPSGNSSLYREMTMSPPAFLPPGALPPLPFGQYPPPPPPFLPPPLPPHGMDHRPPPLGRMSSPPPPHLGYSPPPPDPRDFSPFERGYHSRMSPDRFAPSPPLPSDRSGRSDRGRYLPSPPPFERYPPPPLDYPPPSWDRDPPPPRSGFRPVPPVSGPRREGVHRENKGPGSTSSAISPSHSTESLDRSSKRSGKV